MLSVLVSTHMLVAAHEAGTERFFYSSSACVYNGEKQSRADVTALKEEDAYPAMPEDGYGWREPVSASGWPAIIGRTTVWPLRPGHAITTSTVRKARMTVAAERRRRSSKVIAASCRQSREFEIWGDGEQTRSFMYIDDCIDGTIRLRRATSSSR